MCPAWRTGSIATPNTPHAGGWSTFAAYHTGPEPVRHSHLALSSPHPGTDTDGKVSYVIDTVSEAPLNKVTATIDSSVASGGKLFGRLQAVNIQAAE